MNIGFDLDKIFINYPPFVPTKLIDRLYKHKSNGVLLYRIPSKPEQIIRILSHHPFLRPPIVKNLEFIKKLSSNKKNKHFLISSRFSFLKNRTNAIINKYLFDRIFDSMIFNFQNQQPHIFKAKTVKKLKIDRYVDDDLPLLEFLNKKNNKTKFFWLNEKISKPLKNNLFAINHISEMFK